MIACRDGIRERAGNIDELRSKLGECLYTVQSFYSNTNWVEMSGNIPYYDFGKAYCYRFCLADFKMFQKRIAS